MSGGRAALLLLAALLVFFSPSPAGAESLASKNHVEARLIGESATIRAGQAFMTALVLEVEEGWYVYGSDPGEIGLPTRLDWSLPPGFSAGEPLFPPLVRHELGGSEGWGLEGEVVILSRIQPPATLLPGPVVLRATASWLVCKESCIPGKARLELGLEAVEAALGAAAIPTATDPGTAASGADSGDGARLIGKALAILAVPAEPAEAAEAEPAGSPAPAGALAETNDGAGLLLSLLLAFLGGLLLNLMPCVLPVISLKVLGLVRRASEGGAGATRQGLAYGAGIVTTFMALAGILLVLRAGGRSVGWGFQFQDPAVVSLMAWLFFMVSLNLFGVFELGLGLAGLAGEAGRAASRSRRGGGIPASFAEGLLTTFAATPCTAPFMGAALGWAVAQPAAVALAVFGALGAGMALPYVLVSARPGLLRRLPAPGRWMESLRAGMGFPMAAAALWMAYVLGRIAGPDAVIRLFAALLLCAASAWAWGRWGGPSQRRGVRVTAGIIALVLVGAGLALALLPAGGADDQNVINSNDGQRSSAGDGTWSPARVEELLAEGRPVFVDFTADWCLSCKVNETVVLDSAPVRERFRELGVVLLVADWTRPDEKISRALETHGRAGVPLYLLYAPDGSPPRVLPELLTRRIVLDALDALPQP